MTHRLLRLLGFAVLLVGVAPARGQMHKVAPPETVVRAVGVYEWTGDMAKPTASRLIPVSLFIDGHLEDAGVYMARPVPFALDRGTVYEVDQAGISKGLIDLLFARHLEGADLATVFDDGWFGYGQLQGAGGTEACWWRRERGEAAEASTRPRTVPARRSHRRTTIRIGRI